MFAARITSPQRSVSCLMKTLAASGAPPTGVMFMLRKCSAVSRSLSTTLMASLSLATIAGGVFGGAASAFQLWERKSLTPASSMVGTSGTEAMRVAVGAASILTLSARYCSHRVQLEEQHVDVAGDEVVHGLRGPAIGHVGELRTGDAREQFAGEVGRGAHPLRAEIELTGIGLGIG